MINKFLTAKHWQLFVLTIAPIFIFQILMIMSIESNRIPIAALSFLPIIILFNMFILFGWQWSITIGLLDKLPDGVTIPVKRYKIFFFIPVIYIGIISIFILFMFNGFRSPQSFIPFVALLVPAHLFSMFAIFHNMYFAAKVMKSVEMKKEADFSACAGEFFLIWFFPIGIWILQPRLNKLTGGAKETSNDILDEDAYLR